MYSLLVWFLSKDGVLGYLFRKESGMLYDNVKSYSLRVNSYLRRRQLVYMISMFVINIVITLLLQCWLVTKLDYFTAWLFAYGIVDMPLAFLDTSTTLIIYTVLFTVTMCLFNAGLYGYREDKSVSSLRRYTKYTWWFNLITICYFCINLNFYTVRTYHWVPLILISLTMPLAIVCCGTLLLGSKLQKMVVRFEGLDVSLELLDGTSISINLNESDLRIVEYGNLLHISKNAIKAYEGGRHLYKKEDVDYINFSDTGEYVMRVVYTDGEWLKVDKE